MARRPSFEKERMLGQEDIKHLQENLAHLSLDAVRDFYEKAYRDCRITGRDFPSPLSMQQLVQAWKQLRKWKRKQTGEI
jgi:hypothetical protein